MATAGRARVCVCVCVAGRYITERSFALMATVVGASRASISGASELIAAVICLVVARRMIYLIKWHEKKASRFNRSARLSSDYALASLVRILISSLPSRTQTSALARPHWPTGPTS